MGGLTGVWLVCGKFDWFVGGLRVGWLVCGWFGWFLGGLWVVWMACGWFRVLQLMLQSKKKKLALTSF